MVLGKPWSAYAPIYWAASSGQLDHSLTVTEGQESSSPVEGDLSCAWRSPIAEPAKNITIQHVTKKPTARVCVSLMALPVLRELGEARETQDRRNPDTDEEACILVGCTQRSEPETD